MDGWVQPCPWLHGVKGGRRNVTRQDFLDVSSVTQPQKDDVCFIGFFFFLVAPQLIEFPGQRSDFGCSCGNAKSFTHSAGPGTEPHPSVPESQPIPLRHNRNSYSIFIGAHRHGCVEKAALLSIFSHQSPSWLELTKIILMVKEYAEGGGEHAFFIMLAQRSRQGSPARGPAFKFTPCLSKERG